MTDERLEKIRRVVTNMELLYKTLHLNQDKDLMATYFYAGAIRTEVVRELLDEIDRVRKCVTELVMDLDHCKLANKE